MITEKEFLNAIHMRDEATIKKALDSNTLEPNIKLRALKTSITLCHIGVVKILIEHGIDDLDNTDNNENPPLVSAIVRLQFCSKEKRSDYLQIIRILLTAGANPTYTTRNGNKRFAYNFAPENLKWEVYQIFNEFGKIPTDKWRKEYVDIVECTKRNMKDNVVQILRIAAAEDKLSEVVNEKDAKGDCAVLWAARYNHLTIVKILAAADANFDVRGVNGYSPLDYAKHNKNQEMQVFIEKHLSAKQAAAGSSLWGSINCLFPSSSSENSHNTHATPSLPRGPTPRPGKGKEKVE